VLIASAPLESAFAVVFFVLFLGLKLPRAAALLFLPGLIITVVGLLAGPVPVRRLYLLLGPFTVMFCLVSTAVIIALVFLRRRDMITLLLGSAVTVVLFFWAFDIFSILDVASDRRIFFSRISYSAMVIAIGIGLTWRFARAMNQVDSFAGRMVTLVREAEDKLRAMMGGIVGFEMEVLAWRPTFKLSQNKSADERARVAAGLEAEGSPAIAELMRRLVP